MVTLERYRDETFVNFSREKLEKYVLNCIGVTAALLATPDGFEIATYGNDEAYGADKLAAVGSSLFSLGSSLVNEFNSGNCKSIVIDSDKGKVYISAVNNAKNSVILMVQTNDKATLGTIIHGANHLNNEISSLLQKIS